MSDCYFIGVLVSLSLALKLVFGLKTQVIENKKIWLYVVTRNKSWSMVCKAPTINMKNKFVPTLQCLLKRWQWWVWPSSLWFCLIVPWDNICPYFFGMSILALSCWPMVWCSSPLCFRVVNKGFGLALHFFCPHYPLDVHMYTNWHHLVLSMKPLTDGWSGHINCFCWRTDFVFCVIFHG